MSLRSFRLAWLATAALSIAPSVASAEWTVPPTPNPEGALRSNLLAVDCTSTDSCIAVGYATFLQQPSPRPIAERWDGTSWRVLPTPPVRGGLSGVSCPWPQFCFAVGGPLIEVWNGARWSIQSAPAASNGVLEAVSCSGILACTAVGRDGTGGALALRWEGAGWHFQPTPNPPGADRLYGVSCPLKRTCTAVGGSYPGESQFDASPLAMRWYGRVNAWGLQSSPKPDGVENAALAGVSCPIAPLCVAVGSPAPPFGPPESETDVFAERRIGPNWSLLPTPPLPNGQTFFDFLDAVSCPTVALCRAVGISGPSPLAERFDGTGWQPETIPGSHPTKYLADVSCPSRFFCMAVGGVYEDTAFFFGETLSAKWTP
jgi:hypothetical protein